MASKTINLDEGAPIAEEARTLTVEAQEEVKYAAENLLRTCAKHHITVAGWLFSANPVFVMSVASCSDAVELRLYEILCQMYKRSKTSKSNLLVSLRRSFGTALGRSRGC